MKPQSHNRTAPVRQTARTSRPAPEPALSGATAHPDPLVEEEDFFVRRPDRARDSRRVERRRQYDEGRHAESMQWRSTHERDVTHRDDHISSGRPHLRLVEDSETEEKQADVETERFKRLVKSKKRPKLQPCHFGLLVVTMLLTALSIPLIYSASTAIAIDQHGGDQNFFLTRQAAYVLFGAFVMLMASRIAPEKLRTVSWVLFAVSVLGLVATKFTPLGYTMGNVERWVKLGPLTFQFSELAKIALIGVMADFWSRAAKDVQKSWWPWAAAGGLALIPIGLVVVQPHLSAALVLMMIPVAIALYAGAPWRQILALGGCAVFLLGSTVLMCKTGHMPFLKEYQAKRLMSHFGGDSADDARGGDYQALQGQRAIVRGGALGVGPGASLFKQGHLPAPHTDFIFAVIAEEWGLIGTLGLLTVYASMVFFCFQIGHMARDPFQQLLCAGMGTLVGIQALGNMAVVSGIFPVTGMPLPIVTFGGSGLWCILGGLGLVLAVSRAQNDEDEEEA